MKVPPSATNVQLAETRYELVRSLDAEKGAARAAARRAVSTAAFALAVLVGFAGLAASWLGERGRMSDPVWIVTAALVVLTAVLVAIAIVLLAVAARPRGASDEELLDHHQALTTRDGAAATDRLVEVVSTWHHRAAAAERRLSRATALLGAAALAALATAGVFASGARFHDPERAQAAGAAAPRTIDEAAKALAPRLWLHPAERYGPVAPAAYLQTASLRWRRPGRDARIDPAPVAPAGIGRACRDQACQAFGAHLPHDLTRPHTTGRERPRRLPAARGMYLEAADDLRRGRLLSAPQVPAFYTAAGTEVTYWFLFGASRRFARPPRRTREGDWERFTIRLDARLRPTAAVLPSSESPVGWSDVRKTGERPVLFASLERHALFATPCAAPRTTDTCRADPRAAGLRWDTWTDLRDARKEPWFGFGGAWGHAGERHDLTGPLGPR